MDLDIGTFLRSERLPAEYRGQIDAFWTDLARAIVAWRSSAGAPIVIGICGAQGSGKSTLAKLLKLLIEGDGTWRAEYLSLDDLYLSHAERLRLATDVHPLLATRGVPGTHDVALGIRTIDALTSGDAGTSVALPSFDKSTDDRVAPSLWSQVSAPVDIILFEGWCVGALPQSDESLADPINALERDEDGDGHWRGYVNEQLAGPYRTLFDRLDHLVYLKAPDFAAVRRWRGIQESKLQEAVATSIRADGASGVMNDAALDRFLLFYERITQHLFDTMAGHADTTYLLDDDQKVARRIDNRPPPSPSPDAAA